MLKCSYVYTNKTIIPAPGPQQHFPYIPLFLSTQLCPLVSYFYQGQFVLFKSSWLRGLLLKFNWIIKVETLRKHWPFSLPSVDIVHWSYGYISPLHIWIWSDMDTSFMYAITTVCEFIISDILLCAQKKNMFLYSSITFPLTLPGSPYYNPLVFGWRGVVYIIFSFFKQYK